MPREPMDSLDIAIELASSVVKGACALWAGPFHSLTDTVVDLIHAKVSGKLQQRRAERFFQTCVDTVAEKLLDLMDKRGRGAGATDLEAAAYAVRDTFDLASLSLGALMEADLDARTLERRMETQRTEVLSRALLSESGQDFYNLLLRESCTYTLELISTLPHYDVAAFSEILKRDTQILATLQEILARLPQRQSIDDFSVDYRRLVIQRLDRLQLFGARLRSDHGRRYPLSVAYISLGASSPAMERDVPAYRLEQANPLDYRIIPAAGKSFTYGGPFEAPEAFDTFFRVNWTDYTYQSLLSHLVAIPALAAPDYGSVAGDVSIEDWLADNHRVLLIGEAGSGKSTLLQWLAVRAASEDFAGNLASWNSHVPFFIPLRRYAADGLPAPQAFPMSVGKNIMDAMPQGWVHSHLKSGRCLILIDGLDELREGRPRDQAVEWLEELIESFPECGYVVTSRPGAVEGDAHLRYSFLRNSFVSLELRSMTPAKIRSFIEHWHDAMRVELLDHEERERLSADQTALLATLETDRYIRALCVNPLLCALICALNRERHGSLPKDRMGVYNGALEMLLGMRDRERRIKPGLDISDGAKVTLLQDLALYLARNSWSDAPVDRVREQIARSARTLSEITAEPDRVLQFLIERSGLIRTPSEGRVDFIHRSFQEYLAGKAAIDDDEIGYLLEHATDDQFRDVIVMAMGHALPPQADEFLRGLVSRITQAEEEQAAVPENSSHQLRLLAIACLQTVRRIDPDLRRTIEEMAQDLLPPESFDVAPVLAATGPIVVDLMFERPPATPSQAAASIRVASLIGGRDAMLFISDVVASHDGIEDEVIRAWTQFDLGEYAETVIPLMRWSGRLTITDPSLLPYLSMLNKLTELTVPAHMVSSAFPKRPPSLRLLRVSDNKSSRAPWLGAFDHLQGWEDLLQLDIHLPSVELNLGVLRKFDKLECLRIVSEHSGVPDLSPLARLPRLRVLQLAMPHAKLIRLQPLSGSKDLSIYAPPKVALLGRGSLKNRSKVILTNDFPEFA